MVCCAAWGCTHKSKRYKMYGFPVNPIQRKKWLENVQRKNFRVQKNVNFTKLCEVHFESDQFYTTASNKRRLKRGAVPTIFAHLSRPCKNESLREPPRKLRDPNISVQLDHPYCAQQRKPDDASKKTKENVKDHDQPIVMEMGDANAKKVKVLQEELKTVKSELRVAKKELHRVSNISKQIVKKRKRLDKGLAAVFAPDQLNALCRTSTKGMKWSNAAMKQALRVRFAAGSKGYKVLLDEGYPLPSIRTIQRKMEDIAFEPGVLPDVFNLLRLKVKDLTPKERICCLTLDEMAITPSVDLQLSKGKLMGDVTLPGHSGVASHGLVFMLAGVTTRWKQTVAYHFTGNSSNGAAYKPIVMEILQRAAAIGLHVTAVTSDMGSSNRAMWREFGVFCGEFCSKNSIPHPVDEGRILHFLPDVPHLIKNLKSALVRGQVLTIPQDVVGKHHLPSNKVSVLPVKELINFQEESCLKLAPKLKRKSIDPTHFEKMKVSQALHFFSQSTSAGIDYLVQEEGRPQSHRTTAWFLKTMNHWFDLMSSRHPVMALSRLKPDVYLREVWFLREVVDMFRQIKIGPKGDWKPVQTGIIMATLSILEIQQEMLDGGHIFVLTSRFTQDCLENLFGCIRQKNPVPTPLEFIYALRMISVGQFLKAPQTGSYQQDRSTYLADFLEQKSSGSCDQSPHQSGLIKSKASCEELSKAESNSLFYLAGYVGYKILKSKPGCDDCVRSLTDLSKPNSTRSSSLLSLKEYTDNALCHPSDALFSVVKEVEALVRTNQSILMNETNLLEGLKRKADEATAYISLPSCHGVRQNIIKRYVRLRLSIEAKKIKQERKKNESAAKQGHLGSKSQAMRVLVTKLK